MLLSAAGCLEIHVIVSPLHSFMPVFTCIHCCVLDSEGSKLVQVPALEKLMAVSLIKLMAVFSYFQEYLFIVVICSL